MSKIKIARKKSGFTQEQLAKEIGVTPVYISYIENNHRVPSLSVLKLIAKTLEIKLSDLID